MEVKPAAAPVAAAAAVAAPADAFREILETAQRVKDETIESAKKQAEEILTQAREQAAAGLADLAGQRDSLTQQVDSLRQTAADYRSRFKEMIQAQQEALQGIADI